MTWKGGAVRCACVCPFALALVFFRRRALQEEGQTNFISALQNSTIATFVSAATPKERPRLLTQANARPMGVACLPGEA